MRIILTIALMCVICTGCTIGGHSKSSLELNDSTKPDGNDAINKKDVITVYSARHYAADTIMFEAFTKQTGIKVNEVKGTAEELVERMMKDDQSSDADLFFTVDGGVLSYAKRYDVLQPLQTKLIDENVPAKWRDPDHYWIGITTRARVIVYAKERVKPEELSTYENLTETKWKGRILVRSSTSLYNQSLLASFITLNGEIRSEQWAQGIVRNFARVPEGGDLEQAKAIAEGIGDIAIMNTYYVGQLSASKDSEEALIASNLGVFFPNQQTTGTHLNISGIGLARYAKHKENAEKLVEYMTSIEGQSLLAHESFEYPVNEKAKVPELVKSWGTFKSQNIDFINFADSRQNAIDIFEQVGWP